MINSGAALCITVIIAALISAIFEYGKYVYMGAPYGTNHLKCLNTHLPCGLSPRFIEDRLALQSYFVIHSPGLFSKTFFWEKDSAITEDLISYRVDKTCNSLILEEVYETDAIGQKTCYHDTPPVKQNHVYVQISCDTVSGKIIYKQKEVSPNDISHWESLNVIMISSDIWSIKDILICKRRLTLWIGGLFLLLIQSFIVFKRTQYRPSLLFP